MRFSRWRTPTLLGGLQMNKFLLTAVTLAILSATSLASAQAAVFADNGNQVAMNCKAPSQQLATAAKNRCDAIRQELRKIGFAEKQGAKPIDWKAVSHDQSRAACDVLFMPSSEGGIVNPIYCKSGNPQRADALKTRLDAVIQK